ncbi:MAG: hypothetical protein J5I93_23555 [Pirellulaceae bacterium]|nr:hypothetical protein [Pirellulaceae bacterium]
MLLQRLAPLVALLVLDGALAARADQPARIDEAKFEQLQALVRRQPGESRWMEIRWYPSVWEARRQAAAEGKPIFLMAGSGGAPAAGC